MFYYYYYYYYLLIRYFIIEVWIAFYFIIFFTSCMYDGRAPKGELCKKSMYVCLTDFFKYYLTKFAVIWVKRRQKAGFVSPRRRSKITVTKEKESRKIKREEKERRRREKSNGWNLSFYNSHFGDLAEKTVGQKRSIWR